MAGTWYPLRVLQTAKHPQRPHPQDPKELALVLAGLLDHKKGADIAILDVSGPLVIADYFVIATANNPRHAKALGVELDTTMKRAGLLRRNAAGMDGGNSWVLLDFDDVVVHIFIPESRAFYALESLWADVPTLPFVPEDVDIDPGGAGAETGLHSPATAEIHPGNEPLGSTTPS